MILAVDIGNTNIVFTRMDGRNVKESFRLATNAPHCAEDVIAALHPWFADKTASWEAVLVTSVVPAVTEFVRDAAKSLTGLTPLVHGENLGSDLTVKLDDPSEIGSDLVVAAVAALELETPPLIIFDMGTATTISVLDREGSFLGGAIVPGVVLSLSALSGNTAQLPAVMLEAPEHCIGTNTVDCMRSGALYGAAAIVDGMCERIEAELGEKATVIATGGLAPFVLPLCKRSIRYEEHLLLHGLVKLWEDRDNAGAAQKRKA